MDKIYIVTGGEYSDYSIYRAFANRYDADRYVEVRNCAYRLRGSYDFFEVEEYVVCRDFESCLNEDKCYAQCPEILCFNFDTLELCQWEIKFQLYLCDDNSYMSTIDSRNKFDKLICSKEVVIVKRDGFPDMLRTFCSGSKVECSALIFVSVKPTDCYDKVIKIASEKAAKAKYEYVNKIGNHK